MKSLIKAYINSKLFHKPFYVLYYITRRCNIKCPMCHIFDQADVEQELSLEEIKLLAKNLKNIGIGIIILTGGEPFIRKDLKDIVRIFSSNGILVRTQSNGILVNRDNLKECYENGMDYFTVSLDSLDKDKFDAMCGFKGLWEKAVAALRLSVEMQPYDHSTIVNTVVSTKNIDELPAIAKFVDSCGAYSGFDPVHIYENNPIYSNNREMLLTAQDRPRIERSFKELFRLKKQGLRIGSSLKFLEETLQCLLTQNYKWDCDAGKLFFAVFDNGDILLCKHFKGFSTQRGRDIDKIFRSKAFRDDCKIKIRDCQGCGWGGWKETSFLMHNNGVMLERMKTYLKEAFKWNT